MEPLIKRSAEDADKLLLIASGQEQSSRARDYWSGVTDALLWLLGEDPPALASWVKSS